MVEIKTNVSLEEHLCLNNVAFKTKSLPLVIGYDIGLIIFTVILFIIQSYSIAWMFAGVLVFFNAVIFGMKYFEISKLKKKNISSVLFRYEITDENIVVEVTNKIGQEKGILKYEYIYRVIEDNNYYYVFINSMNVYIMGKKDLSIESIEYVSNLLKQKVKKYKRVK